jgi:hypothetical protein
MKIGLISDEILYETLSLSKLCQIQYISVLNYKELIDKKKIDFLLIESCWSGIDNTWKYKLAKYNFCFWRSNREILRVILYAKDKGIKVVFWSKEDDYHFDRFINVAKHCDYIFTVDENSIAEYKKITSSLIPVHSLMFGIQPKIHNYTTIENKINKGCFVGSYSRHLHRERRIWQKMVFEVCNNENLDINIYDRNLHRNRYLNKYPTYSNLTIHAPIPYKETAKIYQKFLINFNVNSIRNSKTMFSRRLIEILASGGICVSSDALSINHYFKQFVYVIKNNEIENLRELIKQFKSGVSKKDLDRARAGSEYVIINHNIDKRLEKIFKIIY